MKNWYLIGLVLFSFVLAGCPVSSSYPLGNMGETKIDTRLLGTWTCKSEEGEVKKLNFSKKDDYVYNVTIIERGEMYAAETDAFNAWITQLEGKQFLVVQEMKEGVAAETYYVYSLTNVAENKMVTHDITLKVNGTDAITSIEAYREEVKASMKLDGFLASELIWEK